MKPLYPLLLLLLLISSCRKDSELTTPYGNSFKPPVENIGDFEPIIIPVTASILGKVINRNGYPIANALVTLGSETIFTNEQGIFLFKAVEMNAAGTFVTVEKEEYFSGASRFFPKENSENYTTIRLLRKEERGAFSSNEETTLDISGGVKFTIPSNSLLTQNGMTYSGEVQVYSHHVGVEERDFLEFIPGNLQGVNRKNEEVALATYGFVTIELRTVDGEILELAEGRTATMKFPIFDTQLSEAPEEINLWSFNNNYGLWQDRGNAYLEGTEYIGEVRALSFCQIATSFSSVEVSGRLQNVSELPFPNVQLRTNNLLTAESAYAYTDNEGFFTTHIPIDRTTKIHISSNGFECIDLPLEEMTFFSDTDLSNITLTAENEFQIVALTGVLINCEDEGINESFIDVSVGEEKHCYYQLNDNQIALAFPGCNVSDILSVEVRDLVDFHESGAIISDLSNSIDLGLLELCGDGEADYIVIKFPGSEPIYFNDPEIFTSTDFTEIIAEEDTLKKIALSFIGSGVGTYLDESIFSFRGLFPTLTANQVIGIECDVSCGFESVVVEEFGSNPGDRVEGTFSGASLFSVVSGVGGSQSVQAPYVGEFRITLQ